MRQTRIIKIYIKNLKENGSSKKLLIEREQRLRHFFSTV
jgi:hypothetical protein